MLDYYYIIYQQ